MLLKIRIFRDSLTRCFLMTLLCLLTISCKSTNAVLAGKHTTVEQTNAQGEITNTHAFIPELTLKSCQVNLLPVASGKIHMRFADRIFEAKAFNFSTTTDGSCLVKMNDGKSIQ